MEHNIMKVVLLCLLVVDVGCVIDPPLAFAGLVPSFSQLVSRASRLDPGLAQKKPAAFWPRISPAEMMCAREPHAATSTMVNPAGSRDCTRGRSASVILYESEPP